MEEVSADYVYWPADASVPLDEITVGDLLRRVAGQVPDRTALVDGQAAAEDRRRWSYARGRGHEQRHLAGQRDALGLAAGAELG